MKTFSIFLFATFTTIMAWANPAAQEVVFADSNSTPYDTIISWYENATQVKFSEVADTGYEGRCFRPHAKEVGLHSELFVIAKKVSRNAGPDFPDHLEYKVAILEINNRQGGREASLDYIKKNWESFRFTLAPELPLIFWQNDARGEVKRSSKGHLVTEVLTNRELRCSNGEVTYPYFEEICRRNNGVVPSGTRSAVCYFYKKISP